MIRNILRMIADLLYKIADLFNKDPNDPADLPNSPPTDPPEVEDPAYLKHWLMSLEERPGMVNRIPVGYITMNTDGDFYEEIGRNSDNKRIMDLPNMPPPGGHPNVRAITHRVKYRKGEIFMVVANGDVYRNELKDAKTGPVGAYTDGYKGVRPVDVDGSHNYFRVMYENFGQEAGVHLSALQYQPWIRAKDVSKIFDPNL